VAARGEALGTVTGEPFVVEVTDTGEGLDGFVPRRLGDTGPVQLGPQRRRGVVPPRKGTDGTLEC
jgi:hypothetical protein